MTTLTQLIKNLIAEASVTPHALACFDIICQALPKNFEVEFLNSGDVENLWAYRGTEGPLFVFVGHVDVVPPGPESAWASPPFTPTEKNGFLYGRGAADMKSAVAAMVTALAKFDHLYPEAPFRIGLLLTSDEEGKATHGVKHVVEVLKARDIQIDYALVGEASSKIALGDTVKVGRRGTLSGHLKIFGKQGHIAYPTLADNPIHRFSNALTELLQINWCHGNEYFAPTSLQFSNIEAGTGANNVIPGELNALFNFRFSPETNAEALKTQFEAILIKHQLHFTIDWHLGGNSFLTKKGLLLKYVTDAIHAVTGLFPGVSTTGGTSDGRFIAPTGAEVIEFGVINESIHQIDEHVKISDLPRLMDIYFLTLEKFLEHFRFQNIK